MGSSDKEEEAQSNEKPQHEVQLTEGYWLCDMPCTQALWESLMGKNPNRFKVHPPVERVSFNGVQRFLKALKTRPHWMKDPHGAQRNQRFAQGLHKGSIEEGISGHRIIGASLGNMVRQSAHDIRSEPLNISRLLFDKETFVPFLVVGIGGHSSGGLTRQSIADDHVTPLSPPLLVHPRVCYGRALLGLGIRRLGSSASDKGRSRFPDPLRLDLFCAISPWKDRSFI